MKTKFFLILIILFTTLAFTPNTFAQDSPQWHLPEGAKMRIGKGSVNEIAYSPDGTLLAVASGIGIWLYDAETGEEIDLLKMHTSGVKVVSFSLDGKIIAGGHSDGVIRLWDADTRQHLRTLTGHKSAVNSISFSPDGKIVSGSVHYEIRLWDAETGQLLEQTAQIWI